MFTSDVMYLRISICINTFQCDYAYRLAVKQLQNINNVFFVFCFFHNFQTSKKNNNNETNNTET